jgi:ORF6N domain.
MNNISQRILTVRGHRVMIDADLAEVYGVPTKALNQAVKRNADRFPEDFAFRLTAEEKGELVTTCDRFARLKHSTTFPLAFTEHGVIMAANVMNSPRAIVGSVQIVRVFVKMREVISSHRELARRLNMLEGKYDAKFRVVFDTIRALVEPPNTPRRRIGF